MNVSIQEAVSTAETVYSHEFIRNLCKKVAKENTDGFLTPLSPRLLANMREAITKGNIPVTHVVIGSNVWSSFIAHHDLAKMLDPVTKHADILTGYLCNLLGMHLVSDAFEAPTDKCLPRNFCAVVAITTQSFEQRNKPIDPDVIKAVTTFVE